MVRLTSVVVFALASALSAVHAHDVATHGVGDAVQRREFKLAARQSMAKCANSDKLRQLHARTQTNRHDQWQQLRAERQQAAEKVMATNHKSSLKGVKSPADVDVATLFATKPVAHVLEPDVTEGPFYVKGELVRNDVREDQQGIDLYTELQIIDVNTCEPVVGLYLDFWHCNSTGVYSGVVSEINGVPSDLTNVNTTFARGLAPTNNDGVVQFVSKFPGHYAMRTTHIHILGNHGGKLLENNTFVGSAVSNIGQIFFDQDLITEVEKTGVYKTNTQPMTTNAEDGIFLEEASTGFDPIVKYTLLGDTVEDGIFAWISIGVDLEHTAKVYNAATWTDKGGVMNPAPFAFGDMPFVKFDAASSNANDTVVVTPATPTETAAPAPAKSVHPLFALIFVALVLIVSNQVDTDATSTIATTGALVSVYTLIYGAPLNDAIALAVVTTTGSGIAVFMDNIRLSAKEPSGKSLIDWDLLLVLQPSLLIGVLVGVFTRTIVPEWFLSTVIATLLLICGSLLLQASHRRQDETSIGWSINEESSLIVEKPQTVETTPSFGDAFQKVPSDKLGVLVGVLGSVIILQVALYVAVPLVLLCYLGYKSYKTTVDTFERQQLPRVNPEDGEIKWSWHVVHTLPIASTLGGTLFGALGFGCDMVICPFVVEAGLGQKIAGATGPSIVLVAGLMAALECLASGHVNNTLIFFIILLAFAVKSWGKQVVDRFVPEYLRRASVVLLAFAILTLVGGIGLAVEVA